MHGKAADTQRCYSYLPWNCVGCLTSYRSLSCPTSRHIFVGRFEHHGAALPLGPFFFKILGTSWCLHSFPQGVGKGETRLLHYANRSLVLSSRAEVSEIGVWKSTIYALIFKAFPIVLSYWDSYQRALTTGASPRDGEWSAESPEDPSGRWALGLPHSTPIMAQNCWVNVGPLVWPLLFHWKWPSMASW